MAAVTLDASALIAYATDEAGADAVAAVRGRAIVCAVNYSEVLAYFVERGNSIAGLIGRFDWIEPAIVPFDAERAREAARLRPLTRHLQLSLADRACLALARLRRVPVLTTDRAWRGVKAGIDIRVIR